MPIRTVLEAERLRRGLSQYQAGELLHVTQETVSRWEHGQSLPTSAHWDDLARFLSIPRDEVGRMVIEARLADPDGDRIRDLEVQVASIGRKLDRLLRAHDPDELRARRVRR
jgi:transcriptional regulator with XRE-family HTH domain